MLLQPLIIRQQPQRVVEPMHWRELAALQPRLTTKLSQIGIQDHPLIFLAAGLR